MPSPAYFFPDMVRFNFVAPDHVACGIGGIAAGVLILLRGRPSWLSRLVRFVKMQSREHASSPGAAGLTAFVMSGKTFGDTPAAEVALGTSGAHKKRTWPFSAMRLVHQGGRIRAAAAR